ncbi:MAG TPA: hypothetical protein VGB07_36210 [Blastocatellia bacterium]
MYQALTANDGLGFLPAETQVPKWQSILTGVAAAIPTVVGTYNQTRQPTVQPSYPAQYPPPSQPIAQQPAPPESTSESRTGVSTNVGFDLESGLNIGGTRIPVLFLALGGLALFLLYREPPKRGR